MLSDPDLAHARPDGFHRLPVVGIVANLDLVKLMARFGAGIIRKITKPSEAATQERNLFHGKGVSNPILFDKPKSDRFLGWKDCSD